MHLIVALTLLAAPGPDLPACPVTGKPACPCNNDPLVLVVRDGETQSIDGPVRLRTIVVQAGGRLQLRPGAEIVIADLPIDTDMDTEQFGHGILIHGTFEAAGTAKTSWLRAAQGIPAGATSCMLNEAPQGWNPGDVLALPDTRQKPHTKTVPGDSQSEVVTLTKVSGNRIEFTPTQFPHDVGPRDFLTPHVANLTRDIVIRSENPEGVRGHVMAMKGATLDIRHVEFRDMGRTDKGRRLHNAIGDEPGTNQIGRYPLHMHLMGRAEATISGNAVWRSPGWAIVVHGTQGPLVSDNVAYDIQGGAFVCEDGSEAATLEHNLAMKCRNGWSTSAFIKATETNPAETGADGSGFWFRGMGSHCRNNVAADCQWFGYNFQGYANKKPAPPNLPRPGEFAGNEAYASRTGLWATWPQGEYNVLKTYHPSTIEDFTGWHFWKSGIESYHTGRHTFRRVRLYNSPEISRQCSGAGAGSIARTNAAFDASSENYENFLSRFEDCEASGWNIGVRLPSSVAANEHLQFIGGRLQNHVNVVAHMTNNACRREFIGTEFVSGADSAPKGHLGSLAECDVYMRPGTKRALEMGKSEVVVDGMTIYFADAAPASAVESHRIIGRVLASEQINITAAGFRQPGEATAR
ncbi:MAG: right-handed parallel beta-helix repeat-containing protein [Planctomyces sp.]|nr:right-handed parallel beta-helix repeat-containing protein [Planctomyces sp.]